MQEVDGSSPFVPTKKDLKRTIIVCFRSLIFDINFRIRRSFVCLTE